jgi:hypothetical protein
MSDDGLAVYVLYYNPSDYPGLYVVRRQVATATSITVDPEPMAVTDTLMGARALLPVGLHRIERDIIDEPQIVETWL